MGAAGDDLEVRRDHDPVELGDRPPGVKAAAAGRENVVRTEVAQATALAAPFVEVAHQHRRQRRVALGEMGKDRVRLPPPPQSGQVEMHADDAHPCAADPDLGEDGAARLQRGEVEEMALEHLDALLHQQGVAVPADAAGAGVERHRPIVAMLLDHVQRHRAGARSEAAVGLLQRDDVGIELVQHVDRPLRPPLAVGADCLAHIVAGHADHRGAAVPGCPQRTQEHRREPN